MATLYELTGQMLTLQEMMEDPDVDEETLQTTMESVDYEIKDKADGYAKMDRNLMAVESALFEEISRLTARKKRITENRKRLKRNLESSMRVLGETKFKTELFSFSIQKNPPSVNITNKDKIPEEFLIPQEPKVDKLAIIDYVKAHGDTDYAELTQGESLRIR